MRRKNKQINDPQLILDILKNSNIVRLAMIDHDIPYIVPLNYGYHNNALYIHCAKEGRKIDILRKNPYVCFEIEGKHKLETGPKACNWTMKFQSLIGYGHVEILEKEKEKIAGLNILMRHFMGPENNYHTKHLDAIYILKISIENIVGKESK